MNGRELGFAVIGLCGVLSYAAASARRIGIRMALGATAALLLAAVAAVTAWFPARRAARIEPRIAIQDA